MRQHEATLAGLIFHVFHCFPRIPIMSGVSILFQLVRHRERALALCALNVCSVGRSLQHLEAASVSWFRVAAAIANYNLHLLMQVRWNHIRRPRPSPRQRRRLGPWCSAGVELVFVGFKCLNASRQLRSGTLATGICC